MSPLSSEILSKYWAKSSTETSSYHLLPFHALDSAAAAWTILEGRPALLDQLSWAGRGSDPALVGFFSCLVGLHDCGKFSGTFQSLNKALFGFLQPGRVNDLAYSPRHDGLGYLALTQILAPEWEQRGWFGLDQAEGDEDDRWDFLKTLAWPLGGHHGQPPDLGSITRHSLEAQRKFSHEDRAALISLAEALVDLVGGRVAVLAGLNLGELKTHFTQASWLLAGLTVLADWLASNPDFFRYRAEPEALADYWPQALDQARAAVRQSGLVRATPAPFAGPSRLFQAIETWTPLQAWASGTKIGQGPQLYILEDATGSGKTEAALILAQRLMAAGLAEGLYFALPTQATANAMYARLAQVYDKLYRPGQRPSLVLAHASKTLNHAFVASLELAPRPGVSAPPSKDDEESSAQCSAWLAEGSKRSLLAQVGVGTVDQALLATLPVRHQALRLLGLAGSVLIVDEVHAYDPYVTQLLAGLLRFQAALGGSAILLSATLPRSTRRQLLAGFAAGLGDESLAQPGLVQEPDPYPLASHLQATGLTETGLASRPERDREVEVELGHDLAAVAESLLAVARSGGCACWIRDTVADAQEAYELLAERGGSAQISLFHGRLALVDRLRIEEEVLAWFGPRSVPEDRRGRVLVATQVVEQSLDLDFDLLASDLAPLDLILQRVGRLHRHLRAGRPESRPRLIVLGPEVIPDPPGQWFKAFLPGAAAVYRHHGQLYLTAARLKESGRLRLPQDNRHLIEAVFDPEVQDKLPPELARPEEEAQVRDLVESSLANMNCLIPEQGYGGDNQSWEEERRVLTRLGEPTTILYLARWREGRLEPWAGRVERAWELSQVRVRQTLVKAVAPPAEADLVAALAQAKARFPDPQAVILPLIPGQGEVWRGQVISKQDRSAVALYDARLGLRLEL